MVVAAGGDGHAQQVLVLVHGLDHGGEEDDELQVLQRRVAGLEQVLVGGAERPVVVLAAPVDALEGLLVQQAHEVVAACDELHLLHDEQVVVHGLVELGEHRCELVLAGGDLVVLGLGRDAQAPQLVVQILHVGGDCGADGAEVMLLELLALAGRGAEQRAAGDHQITAAVVRLLLDEEILLLVAHVGNDLLGMFAEQGEHALGLGVERGHGAQQRRLLVERHTGVGAKRRGDAQHVILDERGARAVPDGVAAGLEGCAQAAVGEARSVGLALYERLARELSKCGAVLVGLEEAIVLLGRDARKRLEPVRVVRGALGDGPFLHGVGDGICHVQIERLTALDRCGQLFVHVLRKPALHHVFRKDHRTETLGKVGHPVGSFRVASPERVARRQLGRLCDSYRINPCRQSVGRTRAAFFENSSLRRRPCRRFQTGRSELGSIT